MSTGFGQIKGTKLCNCVILISEFKQLAYLLSFAL